MNKINCSFHYQLIPIFISIYFNQLIYFVFTPSLCSIGQLMAHLLTILPNILCLLFVLALQLDYSSSFIFFLPSIYFIILISTNMLSTQQNIQRHRASIDKRINQLELKLKDPLRASQPIINDPIDDSDIPNRRAYIQRQSYVEPRELTALRQRQYNLKQNERPSIQPYHTFQKTSNTYEIREKGGQKQVQIHSQAKEMVLQKETKLANIENKQTINYPRKYQNISYSKQKQKNEGEILDLVTEILKNQKNLEREIHLLRSEWGRQQLARGKLEKQNSFNRTKQVYPLQIISFQQPSPNENNISHSYRPDCAKRNEDVQENSKKQQKSRVAYNKNNRVQEKDKKQVEEKRNKPTSKIKNQSKKFQEAQAQEKLFNLIKNQKSRNDRLIVKEELKNMFWKEVEQRILTSEHEYKQAMHRNNKCESEHLINTNQLQKKLREQILSKVHSQSNNCLFK